MPDETLETPATEPTAPAVVSTFAGEGNPSDPQPDLETHSTHEAGTHVLCLSSLEQAVLGKVLERETTAAVSHGGLRDILGLLEHEAETLLALLRRV